MTELEQYIHQCFNITPTEISRVGSFFQETHLKKGDFYLKKGHYCSTLSFVKEGLLRVYRPEDGREITQWISAKGDFITDLASLYFRTPGRWMIQALSDCTLYTIGWEQYQQIGKLVGNWHELEKNFIALCFVKLEERFYAQISMSAEERYQLFMEQRGHLLNEVPLQYIASMLGMTPETLSRIRRKSIS